MNKQFGKLVRAIGRRTPRRLAVALAGVSLVLGFGAAIATPAHATSTHCAWINPVRIAGRTIPLAQYCFTVNGSGLYVNFTQSSYTSGYVYNLAEHVDAFDNQGNDYVSFWSHNSTGTLYGTHAWSTTLHGWARPGSICGTAYSSGVVIARVCDPVHS